MSPRKPKQSFPLPFAEPEEVGFSAARLAQIGPQLQKFVDAQKVPNLVTLAARHGKIVHYEARGFMDFESKKPAGKDTVFRLYSNSKPITGVATMICVEEGWLTLDDPVSKYIPAFKDPVVRVLEPTGRQEGVRPAPAMIPTVPARREITVRDCLRNTTGLPTARRAPILYMTEYRDVLTEMGWFPGAGRRPTTVREMVEAQAKLPLVFQPGTEFEYHVGYPVVGVVLETVTGKTLEEFYQERIFKPLGMKDTSFYLPEKKFDRFPTCYRPTRRSGQWQLEVAERPENSEKVKGPRSYFGAGGDMGGVLSTAADYARFAQMLLNGGELDSVRILGRKTVQLMASNHLRDDIQIAMTGPGFGFGMGVGVYKGGGPPMMRSVGTFGWGGAAGTICWIDPKEDLFFLIFTQVLMHQAMPGNIYQEEFERLVYQSLV